MKMKKEASTRAPSLIFKIIYDKWPYNFARPWNKNTFKNLNIPERQDIDIDHGGNHRNRNGAFVAIQIRKLLKNLLQDDPNKRISVDNFVNKVNLNF